MPSSTSDLGKAKPPPIATTERPLPTTRLLARLVHGGSWGTKLTTAEYSFSNAAATSSAAASSLCRQPEHARILPAKVQHLNFLGQPDEERPSKHQRRTSARRRRTVHTRRRFDTAYTQTTCSTGAVPTPQSSAANTRNKPCSPTWQAVTPTQPHKPGNKN